MWFGLLWSVASALAWAGFDAARKGLVHRERTLVAAFWVNLLQGLVFLLWSLGSALFWTDDGPQVRWREYGPYAASVLALQVAANLLFFRSLHLSPLGLTIPFLSLTPVCSAGFEWWLRGVQPNGLQALGLVFVTAGALTLGRAQGAHRTGGLLGALRTEPGSWMMALVAVLWSLATVLDAKAMVVTTVPIHATVQTLGVAFALAILFERRAVNSLSQPAVPVLALAVVLAVGALSLQLMAIQQVAVSVVEGLKRAVGVVAAITLGMAFFSERPDRRQILTTAVIVLGGVILMFGSVNPAAP